MDTARALIDAAPNFAPMFIATAIGVVLAVVFLVASLVPAAVSEDEPRNKSLANLSRRREAICFGAFLVLVIGACVFMTLRGTYLKDAADNTRADLIATYLLAEHDLITLSPVSIEKDAAARTTAVDAEGALWEVDITWLANVSTQLPNTPLPEAFSPIGVTLTATTPSADAQG